MPKTVRGVWKNGYVEDRLLVGVEYAACGRAIPRQRPPFFMRKLAAQEEILETIWNGGAVPVLATWHANRITETLLVQSWVREDATPDSGNAHLLIG